MTVIAFSLALLSPIIQENVHPKALSVFLTGLNRAEENAAFSNEINPISCKFFFKLVAYGIHKLESNPQRVWQWVCVATLVARVASNHSCCTVHDN